jgi:hypothetical protein
MSLPLTRGQVLSGQAWLTANFAPEILAAVAGSPVTLPLACAIACKETGFIWIGRTQAVPAATLLARLVGDASGDVANAPRSAFPRNTAEFRARFGDAFADMLIAEANLARGLRGLSPAKIVYKGYGIFQYDLQHVVKDEAFFREKKWHAMGHCLAKLVAEFNVKWPLAKDDPKGQLWGAIRRYNGSGRRAEQYADHVTQFLAWCEGRD